MFDIFLIFAQNRDCGYTLDPHRRGGSNEYIQSLSLWSGSKEYLQSMFWSKSKGKKKKKKKKKQA